MQLADAIKLRLEYFIHRKGLNSLWELYKASGIPKSTINAYLSANTIQLPKISTLLHLCESLDTNLVEFFNDPIFLDVIDTSEDKNDTK